MTASDGRALWLGKCATCGKRSYASKAEARRARRQVVRRHGGHLSVYRCGEWWHFGHLPRQIARGDASRADLRRKNP